MAIAWAGLWFQHASTCELEMIDANNQMTTVLAGLRASKSSTTKYKTYHRSYWWSFIIIICLAYNTPTVSGANQFEISCYIGVF